MAFDATKPVNGSAVASAEIRANFTALMRQIGSVIASVGNVGAGEDILASFSLTAALLTTNGDSLKGIFWGQCANNANAKTIKVRVIEGANNTVLLSVSLTVSQAGHWLLGVSIVRVSATTFRAAAQVVQGPANSQATVSAQNVTSTSTATWANAVEVRITGEATSNNDITVEGGTLSLCPA
jgi:hypothetical protein